MGCQNTNTKAVKGTHCQDVQRAAAVIAGSPYGMFTILLLIFLYFLSFTDVFLHPRAPQ